MTETKNETLELAPVETTLPLSIPAKDAPITAAQAKVEAVAALTMAAYEKAATLELTPEERKALQADFPDEAFQPGAAGKENLIYIEHASLRDRMNDVFGMGMWAIVPRNRWAEDFTFRNSKGQQVQASRVYVEAMLVVRGCFVGEAVGDMVYYKNNESQNYGDAVEGAKTAAFRRCAKEFGIGLQAWKKDWCAAWWSRKRGQVKPTTITPHDTSKSPGKAKADAPVPPREATPVTRKAMMEWLFEAGLAEQDILQYGIDAAIILPNEGLIDWPLHKVGTTKKAWGELRDAIQKWIDGDVAPESPEPPKEAENEEWRSFPMPFGKNAGKKLEDLTKNYLFGLWANYTVETTYKGKARRPDLIELDTKFREMLDAAGIHYEFKKPDDAGEITP